MGRPALAVPAIVSAAILLLLASACGDSDGDDGAATATPVSTAEATPGPGALATSTPDETGVSRTEVPPIPAAQVGRDDCPEGWLAWEQTAYSICFPPDYYAAVWYTADTGPWFSVRLVPGEPVAHTPYTFSAMAVGAYQQPTECLFEAERVVEPDSASIEAYSSPNAEGTVCRAELSGTVQLKGALEAPSGGIEFRAQATTGDLLDLAMEILASIRPR